MTSQELKTVATETAETTTDASNHFMNPLANHPVTLDFMASLKAKLPIVASLLKGAAYWALVVLLAILAVCLIAGWYTGQATVLVVRVIYAIHFSPESLETPVEDEEAPTEQVLDEVMTQIEAAEVAQQQDTDEAIAQDIEADKEIISVNELINRVERADGGTLATFAQQWDVLTTDENSNPKSEDLIRKEIVEAIRMA